MKIALIRRQFAETGGAELYLQRLLAALLRQGHEPHLFCEAWDARRSDVQVHPVEVKASRAERPLVFAEHVAREVAKQPFDCVFSLERTVAQDVYRAGDGVHRVWLQRRRQFAPWWRKLFIGRGAFHRNMCVLEARTFNSQNTRRIIVNSEMVRREILANFSFPAERIHLVRNGIEIARFKNARREETRQRFGFTPQDKILLFVGSGWERKGLRYLVEASRQLVRTGCAHKVLVVGKGRTAGLTSPHIVFAGAMKDAENAYAAADLFVFPPIYEPSANVVCEALASGLPVITTEQNGAGEIVVPGQTGSVIPRPDDLARLAAEITHWLARAPHRVSVDTQLLSLDRNVAETLAILQNVAAEKAAGRSNP